MITDVEIKSLGQTGYQDVFRAFNRAFEDYEMQLDKEQLHKMLVMRGYDPALSFAAFANGEIVAFTLNGIGNFNGIPTAYDTGTGTLKGYRGRGLATKVFEYSIPYLRRAGIGQYLLEVLQHNSAAVSVYRKLGFEISREFSYYGQENPQGRAGNLSCPYPVRPIPTALPETVKTFWDFAPSWQNGPESVRRAGSQLIAFGAFDRERLAGYCILDPASGDLTRISVDKQYRRKGIGTALLTRAIGANKHTGIKVVNTESGCASMEGFLRAMNIPEKGKQFEMIKRL